MQSHRLSSPYTTSRSQDNGNGGIMNRSSQVLGPPVRRSTSHFKITPSEASVLRSIHILKIQSLSYLPRTRKLTDEIRCDDNRLHSPLSPCCLIGVLRGMECSRLEAMQVGDLTCLGNWSDFTRLDSISGKYHRAYC